MHKQSVKHGHVTKKGSRAKEERKEKRVKREKSGIRRKACAATERVCNRSQCASERERSERMEQRQQAHIGCVTVRATAGAGGSGSATGAHAEKRAGSVFCCISMEGCSETQSAVGNRQQVQERDRGRERASKQRRRRRSEGCVGEARERNQTKQSAESDSQRHGGNNSSRSIGGCRPHTRRTMAAVHVSIKSK